MFTAHDAQQRLHCDREGIPGSLDGTIQGVALYRRAAGGRDQPHEVAAAQTLRRLRATRVKELLAKTQQSAGSDKCKAMAALIDSGETMIKDAKDDAVRDASLILAAQRVEHFEMASYGTLRGWAELLGEQQSAQILDEILRQEGHADHLLTEISQAANARARRAA